MYTSDDIRVGYGRRAKRQVSVGSFLGRILLDMVSSCSIPAISLFSLSWLPGAKESEAFIVVHQDRFAISRQGRCYGTRTRRARASFTLESLRTIHATFVPLTHRRQLLPYTSFHRSSYISVTIRASETRLSSRCADTLDSTGREISGYANVEIVAGIY